LELIENPVTAQASAIASFSLSSISASTENIAKPRDALKAYTDRRRVGRYEETQELREQGGWCCGYLHFESTDKLRVGCQSCETGDILKEFFEKWKNSFGLPNAKINNTEKLIDRIKNDNYVELLCASEPIRKSSTVWVNQITMLRTAQLIVQLIRVAPKQFPLAKDREFDTDDVMPLSVLVEVQRNQGCEKSFQCNGHRPEDGPSSWGVTSQSQSVLKRRGNTLSNTEMCDHKLTDCFNSLEEQRRLIEHTLSVHHIRQGGH
jgi:hypothetical protein